MAIIAMNGARVEEPVPVPGELPLIQKWLKAGVSEDGQWSETEVGGHKEQWLLLGRKR